MYEGKNDDATPHCCSTQGQLLLTWRSYAGPPQRKPGSRPDGRWKTSKPPFGAMEMHPFCLRHLPRRGRFVLHSAFVLISISRHNIATTSPSGGSGALAPKGVHFHAPKGGCTVFAAKGSVAADRRHYKKTHRPLGRYHNPLNPPAGSGQNPLNLLTPLAYGNTVQERIMTLPI